MFFVCNSRDIIKLKSEKQADFRGQRQANVNWGSLRLYNCSSKDLYYNQPVIKSASAKAEVPVYWPFCAMAMENTPSFWQADKRFHPKNICKNVKNNMKNLDLFGHETLKYWCSFF